MSGASALHEYSSQPRKELLMGAQQFLLVECPYCGWKTRIPVPVHEDEEMARVAVGLRPLGLFNSQHNPEGEGSQNASLEIANDYIDKTCSNCKRSFLYNKRTGETRS